MGTFFESKFIKDLEQGKIPEVTVNIKLDAETAFQIGFTLFFVGVSVLIVHRLIRNAK